MMLLALLWSCSSQDTTKEELLKQKEEELEEREKALADKESEINKKLSEEAQKELASKLLELWFDASDPFKFNNQSEQHVSLNGKSYGMFRTGLSCVKDYGGGLYEAVSNYTGKEEDAFVESIQDISGLKPYQDDFQYTEYYQGFNPEFVDWAVVNLVPKSGSSLLGYTSQDFYDRVFKRLLRILAITHLYLDKNLNYQKEVDDYVAGFTSKDETDGGFYGPRYLSERFGQYLNEYDVNNYEELEADQAFGFWLRRKIDGSESVCWKHLQDIMLDYDKDWFQEYEKMDKIEDKAFSEGELQALYSCFFNDPYEYMFEGSVDDDDSDELQINGHYYGRYAAGIGGILGYGSLDNCAFEILRNKFVRDGGDINPDMGILGLYHGQAILKTQQEAGFRHFNPEFIKWGAENMVPKKDNAILGYTYQKLYDRVFQRFFRTMALSYLHLQNNRDFEAECQKYSSNMKEEHFEAMSYLGQEYEGVLPEMEIISDSDGMTPQLAIGFWLRRGIDGTADELWEALEGALKEYDETWLLTQKR